MNAHLVIVAVDSVATQRDHLTGALLVTLQLMAIVEHVLLVTIVVHISVSSALVGKRVPRDRHRRHHAWHHVATKDSSWWDYHAWRVLMASIKTRARRQQRRASFVLLVLRLLRHRQHAPSALVASTRINTLRRWLRWRGKILLWVRLKIGRASPRRPMEQSWPQP